MARDSRQGPKAETKAEHCLWPCPRGLLSWLSHTIQDYLLGVVSSQWAVPSTAVAIKEIPYQPADRPSDESKFSTEVLKTSKAQVCVTQVD